MLSERKDTKREKGEGYVATRVGQDQYKFSFIKIELYPITKSLYFPAI